MNEPIFVQVENEGWPVIEVSDVSGGGSHGDWRAFMDLDDKLWSTVNHQTPEEAVAYLERMLIQELCVPGPGPTDRRAEGVKGRRAYDTFPWHHNLLAGRRWQIGQDSRS